MRVILSLAMVLAGATCAAAQTACSEPTVPPPIDGAQASADQLRAAMAQARDFIAQAGMYQGCLAQSGDPDARTKIGTSQKNQDRVGQSINTALDTYKRSHHN